MLDVRKPILRHWLYAAVLGVLAVALRAGLGPVLGSELPFAVAFPSVVVAAVLWGPAAGILTAAVCALGATHPGGIPVPPDVVRPLQIAVFLLGAVLIASFCGQLGRQRQRSADAIVLADPFDTPLGHWLRAVLWCAFLVPMTAFVFVSWWAYDRTERDAEAAVSHGADLAYEHARRIFAVSAEIARRADKASRGTGADVREHEASIHQRLEDLATGVPGVVNISVWDADGSLLTRSDAFPVDRSSNVSDRDYFKEQRQSPNVLGISPLMKGRLTGVELTSTTVRRLSADGAFLGIVSVSLAPGFFRDYYQSLAKEQPTLASFVLARADGQILARWPRSAEENARLSDENAVTRLIQAGTPSGTVVLPQTENRATRLVSFKKLDDFPLYVLAGVGRDAMFAGWARFEALLAAVLLPTAAGLTYVSWIALKKTRREAATAARLQEQVQQRAAAERKMLESQKFETIGLITAGVAHDFNNLLAIVGASLHTLKRQFPEVAKARQFDAMTRAMASGVRLTRQLLSFTRKQALKPETIELQNWLPATENLVRSTVGASISWTLEVDAGTRPITVDTAELELAIINLVVNARHAMPQGGHLSLHAGNADAEPGSEAARVSIRVKDSGVGIPPENLTRVFEPFFTTRTKGAGSGLGLGQVQNFCAQAGGTVRIESQVGMGTSVLLCLPAAVVATPAAIDPAPPMQGELHGKVLLVEDNEDVASTTAHVLRAAGLSVALSPSADAALAHLGGPERPDVVLSDIAMPGMDGIAFAFLLRDRYPSLPVLLTSGYADKLEEAVAGGLRVLPKPVSPERLLSELKTALQSRTDAHALGAPG